METRTRLTTPPGQEPASAASTGPADERYVPGLRLAVEPGFPSRYRRLYALLIALAVVAAIAIPAYVWWSNSQTFDPSVPADQAEVTDPAQIPGEEIPGEG